MLKKPKFNAVQLRFWLHYNPFTGDWIWKNPMAPRLKSGAKAGGISHGYRRIKIYAEQYVAHRLAWYYVTGKWPIERIDHKDGNGLNNKWTNLRLSSHALNIANSKLRSDNTVGLKGVTFDGVKYVAQIQYAGTHYYLGRFVDAKTAHAVYVKAKELFW